MVQPLHLPRRQPRPGDAIADQAEGADVSTDGRHRGGADDLAPGKTRRRQKLGLPLLLAARRYLHAAGADELRLYRGSLRLAQLAVTRRGRSAGEYADHVWDHGPAPLAGMGGRLAAWLRRRT